MEVCERVIGGARLTCPNHPWMVFPSNDPNDYDGCCGAGETGSWTERAVPERILGLRVSVACYVHDCWWAQCERNLSEFRQSNGVFKDNMLELNRVFGGGWLERVSRVPIIYGWWLLVSGKRGLQHFLA